MRHLRLVSTHSRPKAAGPRLVRGVCFVLFQHTAARRRLAVANGFWKKRAKVSTHSRPKAAGSSTKTTPTPIKSFNTQPPEGGWQSRMSTPDPTSGFNTQPPEGGWVLSQFRDTAYWLFQHTAARRRLATTGVIPLFLSGFQHTAARRRLGRSQLCVLKLYKFQHTAARRRLGLIVQ